MSGKIRNQGSLYTLLIGAGFVLFWSSGFVGGELATRASLPSLSLFAWRFIIAAFVLSLVTVIWVRTPLSWQRLCREMLVGLFTMGGFLLGILLALQLGVSAGLTALIAALQPLLAAVLAGLWFGERLPSRAWWGMVVAMLGVSLCVAGDLQIRTGMTPLWAYGLPVLSVLSVTLGSLLSPPESDSVPIPAALAMQLLSAAGVFILAAYWLDPGGLAAPHFAVVDVVTLAWLILLSSLGGYGFFVAALRHMGVTRTALLVYLTPPVTLIWAGLMFNDWPGWVELAGMAIAAVGVAMAIPGQGVSSVETHASVTDGTLADGWQPDKAQNEATDQATNMCRIVDWAEEANGNVQHNKAQGVA